MTKQAASQQIAVVRSTSCPLTQAFCMIQMQHATRHPYAFGTKQVRKHSCVLNQMYLVTNVGRGDLWLGKDAGNLLCHR